MGTQKFRWELESSDGSSEVQFRNSEVQLGTRKFIGNSEVRFENSEVLLRTRKFSRNSEVCFENTEVPFGPYSVHLGRTTTGTCSELAFCRSEARHYRVPVLHSTSAGSHYQT
ncbi:hypothetical protein Rs2_15832 [Raphanus sativus]|nr:hypothetical protein Rs2_15832 [Raphanus sativus]